MIASARRVGGNRPGEDALAQSPLEQLLTVVALYTALGGGWKRSDEAWTATQ